MASFHKSSSLYRDTPVKDFYLDLWQVQNINIQPDETDTEYTIEPKYAERPDLLANSLYGNSRLWWVLAMRNKDLLIDPIADFQPGLTIFLPTQEMIAGIV